MNIFVLNKGGSKIGVLSNQGANPPAPFFDDLFTQELETGADTYYFSSISNSSTENLFVIGNKIMFEYNNKQRLFTIASIEYEHKDGQKIIGVYAEGIGFELLDVFMEKPKSNSDSGDDGNSGSTNDGTGSNKVYIDENGNIIYNPGDNDNSSSGDIDGTGSDKVWIDGDGNIIYDPKGRDENKDSLEFKNISYPTFLKMILKNTGWSYICQPGLESNKQDMSVRYNTNIYAILQDSMQSYQGVELEFIYEYNNGNIKRVVKAYKNGGRGSNTGKRLQYGVNVRGITKMQEIVDEKEEDVVYEGIATINGHQVQLTYDVDIALKSMDVEAMRIGDGYTVIDHDFRPVIEFKARIGKIEISFSDPTRNKCYIANFKQIRGAVSENGDSTDEDDIEDLIDDKLEEYEVGEHTHDRLVVPDDENHYVFVDVVGLHPNQTTYEDEYGQTNYLELDLGSDINRWRILYANRINLLNSNSDHMTVSLGGKTSMFESSNDSRASCHSILSCYGYGSYDWSDSEYHYSGFLSPYSVCITDPVSKSWMTGAGLNSPRTFSYNHAIYFDNEDMSNISEVQASGLPGTVVNEDEPTSTQNTDIEYYKATKKDFLDFILNEVKIYEYSPKILNSINAEIVDGTQIYFGLLSDDYIDHTSAENCVWKSKVGYGIFRNMVSDVNDDGKIVSGEGHEKHTYSLNALVCALIGAFQQYALTQAMYATVDYVEKAVTNVDAWTNTLQVVDEGDIEPLASTPDKINGGYIMDGTLKGSQVSTTDSNKILTSSDIVNDITVSNPKAPGSSAITKLAYDKAVEAYNKANEGDNNYLKISQLSDSVTSNDSNKVASSAAVKTAYDKATEAYNKAVEALENGGEDDSGNTGDLNGAIEYIATGGGHMLQEPYLKVNTEMQMEKGLIVRGDFIITGENSEGVGGLIVPGMSADEATIGALTCNTINGVDVDNLLSSTATASIDLSEEQQEIINALQNTVQQQQETIAALEARLARIEQYLDLGDDI